MNLKYNVPTFILTLTLALQAVGAPSSAALVCSKVFGDIATSHFELLAERFEVTESQILKAAESDILGDRTMPEKAKEAFLDFFNLFNLNRDYRNQLNIEIRRRDYRAALAKMGVQAKVDPMYIFRNNAHYFKLMFSLGANSAVNYLSYHYLGTAGFLVSIPETRLFRPDKIPDEVILEMLEKPEGGPFAKAYLGARIKHGADMAVKSISNYFAVGILSWMVLFHHQMITDPVGYTQQQMLKSASTLVQISYQTNLDTIQRLETKRAGFESSGELEMAAKADELIEQIKQQNLEIIKQMPSGI